jgi:hypothetical protein
MKPWRKSFFVFLFTIYVVKGHSQDPEPAAYRTAQLEAVSEKKDSEPEDDSYETDMETLREHPVNMNTATEDDLVQMHLLNVLQIRNFLSYRNLLGPLLSLHELQAVPGWDLETIRHLLPFIMVGRDESLYSALRERWRGGDAAVLLRSSRVLEKSRGFEKPILPGTASYMGSPQKLFIRYTYSYKQLLSYGLTGEKDAGEPFFRGAQRLGFDFYSFHFFLRHLGIIRALAIGDFTVNLGQGLIQWQTISFTKSSQVLAIKREANCLRPYHSAGEFNFHRGLGISLQKGKWETSLFISSRKISTNREPDNSGREELFSSFQNSGYHRTAVEIADRNNVRQISAGGNIRFSTNRFSIGFNWIGFSFSRAFQKPDELYNLFSFKGKKLTDYSIDYGYTHRNLHLFGELAMDSRRSLAFIQGALISLNEKADLVFLYRNISTAYQSLYSDAFTESSAPNNEKGLYAGFAFRPAPGLQVNIYYDLFVFPWLKYRVDAPSGGKDLIMQAIYQPTKAWHFSTFYKQERKTGNSPVLNMGTYGMETVIKQRWRIETEFMISRSVSFTSRMEFVWLRSGAALPVQGFLGTAGFSYRNPRISGNMAVTVFETADYDTRIYAYEPDLLYNFSLPAFYGRGIHYYINLHRNFNRLKPGGLIPLKISGWIKWSQTFYPVAVSLGSGLDEINGNRKSEIKLQILAQWR